MEQLPRNLDERVPTAAAVIEVFSKQEVKNLWARPAP